MPSNIKNGIILPLISGAFGRKLLWADSLIQMVLTLPALLGLIFAFAAGPASMRISKKRLVIFSLSNGLIGGLMALILGPLGLGFLLFASILIGVAQGFNATLSMALITDYFRGQERSSMMGLQSAFLNGGSMVFLFSSGLLANFKWNHAYLVYLAFLPVLIIVIRYLPHDLPVKQSRSENLDSPKKLNASVYLMALFIFFFGSFFFVFQTNIALLVVSKGYGDATLSGMINTALSASGMVTGIRYGKIKDYLKIRTIPFGMAAVGLGMGLIYLVGSLPSLFVSAVLIGFGISLVMPTGFYIAANVVESRLQPTAIALLTAAVNLGMFVSPLLFNMINFQTAESTLLMKFIISSIALLILAIAFVFGNRYILKMQGRHNRPL